MSLVTEVTDRIGAQRLVELTNPQLPSATTIDSTRLARAATDAAAEFARRTGEAFSDSDAYHVSVCVDGVVCLLQRRMGVPPGDNGPCERWNSALSEFTNSRTSPITSATQTPTADDADGLPDFDRRKMAQFIPEAQPSDSDDDE